MAAGAEGDGYLGAVCGKPEKERILRNNFYELFWKSSCKYLRFHL